jgi:TRAP-type C4-dicarboxylate transport system permease small subunit
MQLLNVPILKAPMNWVFVAVVLAFVLLVTFHFVKKFNLASETE